MSRLDLVNAINEFDGYDDASYLKLRDLVCEISESKIYESDDSLKELLYIASQKMRNFGYNKMNGFNADVVSNDSRMNINAIVDHYYASDSGYKLDYEQKKALDIYQSLDKRRLFLSAPTAFGKTFILQEILLKNNYRTVVLIFPTVSLLNENTKSISAFIKRNQLKYKIFSSTRELVDDEDRKIFILTPERVMKLLAAHPSIAIDFFFMDEIYKVDSFFDSPEGEEEGENSDRDQVFRIVLYILSKRVKDFYLAGPYINTDALGVGFSNYLTRYGVAVHKVDKEMISKQHLMAWTTKLTLDNESYRLPPKSYERLLAIIDLIEKLDYGRSLVYMAYKCQIDVLAKHIVETRQKRTDINDERLKRFLTHLRTRYSANDHGVNPVRFWSLPHMLERGFGVHHGSLPKYVQQEVLELFNAKRLDVIISTTSITEGVNIDAKNVIFYGITKGGKELKVFDIKNINGRAGRYYHNFIGRIFYLNKEVKKILDERMDEALDFTIFGNKELDKVDLDNADLEDLTEKNARIKQEREREIAQSGIPPEVFGKNKLVDKLKQIHMAQALEKLNKNQLEAKAKSYSSVQNFLASKELPLLMGFLFECGLIDEYQQKSYPAIATNYSISGFQGLLEYEADKVREKSGRIELSAKDYDSCYRRAFEKIRTVIEFQIPRLLTIYSHIFEYACVKQGVKFNAEMFDSIVMFYELGVFTNVGVVLAEKGFPIAAVRLLEDRYEEAMVNLQTFFEQVVNSDQWLLTDLDDYERSLLLRLLDES